MLDRDLSRSRIMNRRRSSLKDASYLEPPQYTASCLALPLPAITMDRKNSSPRLICQLSGLDSIVTFPNLAKSGSSEFPCVGQIRVLLIKNLTI